MNRQIDDQGKTMSFGSGLRSRSAGTGMSLLVLLAFTASCAQELPQATFIKPVKTVVFGGPGVSTTRSFPGTVQAV